MRLAARREIEAVNYLDFYDWSKSVIWTNSCVIPSCPLLPLHVLFPWLHKLKNQLFSICRGFSYTQIIERCLMWEKKFLRWREWNEYLGITLNLSHFPAIEVNQRINYHVKHSFLDSNSWQTSLLPSVPLSACPCCKKSGERGSLVVPLQEEENNCQFRSRLVLPSFDVPAFPNFMPLPSCIWQEGSLILFRFQWWCKLLASVSEAVSAFRWAERNWIE